jgi:threonine dehydrogenase-like Zn-dependent dehydrogenase
MAFGSRNASIPYRPYSRAMPEYLNPPQGACASSAMRLITVEAARDLLPRGADHVFDFVGLKQVAEQGLAMLSVGGGLYLVGVAKPEVSIDRLAIERAPP